MLRCHSFVWVFWGWPYFSDDENHPCLEISPLAKLHEKELSCTGCSLLLTDLAVHCLPQCFALIWLILPQERRGHLNRRGHLIVSTNISCKYQHDLATTSPLQVSYSKCSGLLLGEWEREPILRYVALQPLPQPEAANEPSELGGSLLKY